MTDTSGSPMTTEAEEPTESRIRRLAGPLSALFGLIVLVGAEINSEIEHRHGRV